MSVKMTYRRMSLKAAWNNRILSILLEWEGGDMMKFHLFYKVEATTEKPWFLVTVFSASVSVASQRCKACESWVA